MITSNCGGSLNFVFWEFVFQYHQSMIHQSTASLEVCVVRVRHVPFISTESMAEDFEY